MQTMPWPCYPVVQFELPEDVPVPGLTDVFTRTKYRLSDGSEVFFRQLKTGAMFTDSERGLCVKLPGATYGVIWALHKPGTNGFMWTVMGEVPNVTATPSINFVGIYHGFVTDGMVMDDCEGRKFDDYGKSL